jgi:hypothetical protein
MEAQRFQYENMVSLFLDHRTSSEEKDSSPPLAQIE